MTTHSPYQLKETQIGVHYLGNLATWMKLWREITLVSAESLYILKYPNDIERKILTYHWL